MVYLVQEYEKGLNIMKSVSKMGWWNQIPDDRSLLLRKTFIVTSQVNKTHLNGLDLLLYFLPRQEDVVSGASTVDMNKKCQLLKEVIYKVAAALGLQLLLQIIVLQVLPNIFTAIGWVDSLNSLLNTHTSLFLAELPLVIKAESTRFLLSQVHLKLKMATRASSGQ